MSLYEVVDNESEVDKLAKGFLKEANVRFDNNVREAEDLIQRFWYRNRDADGNPLLEPDGTTNEPTGIEILQAMGTAAQSVIDVAYQRVSMLVTVATLLGQPELVDVTKVANPYDLTFNPDGSLDTYVLKGTEETSTTT